MQLDCLNLLQYFLFFLRVDQILKWIVYYQIIY